MCTSIVIPTNVYVIPCAICPLYDVPVFDNKVSLSWVELSWNVAFWIAVLAAFVIMRLHVCRWPLLPGFCCKYHPVKHDECRNPLCNMRLLWLFTVDVAHECTDVAFIQLNQLCQNRIIHRHICTEGHFKAFKVIRFSDRIDKHLDWAFLRYLHIYLPWYSAESRSETLKDWSCFHRKYFLRLISALFRFCIAHSWYLLHISSCTKLRVFSNASSWQTLWFEFH